MFNKNENYPRFIFIDNLDFLFAGSDKIAVKFLEENFYKLCNLGIGVVYTCKASKLFESKIVTVVNTETQEKEKIELVKTESIIKPICFKSMKKNSILFYGNSEKKRVLLLFEHGIVLKNKFLMRLDNFNYKSFENKYTASNVDYDIDLI